MLIANVGDCQVVMGRRGKEVVLISEDLEGSKGSSGPLPAPTKVQETFLSKEDEFLSYPGMTIIFAACIYLHMQGNN